MPTNMRQPWDQGFDSVFSAWWLAINRHLPMTIPIRAGTGRPLQDWRQQRDPDHIYYYALDDWTEADWRAWSTARFLMLPRCCLQIITALRLTQTMSPDIAHEQEIPGIWLVRQQIL